MPWYVYELIIFAFLIGAGVLFFEWLASRKYSKKRSVLSSVVMCVLALGWVVIFYGSFIEPHILVVDTQNVVIGSSNHTLRAAVLSDLHVGPYKDASWVKRVVDEINAQSPDVVLMAGDFIMTHPDEASFLEPLKELRALFGVYAVLGNHDYENDAERIVTERLSDYGVRVLLNEHVFLNEDTMVLAGVSDIWYDGDLDKTLRIMEQVDRPVILLAHNPDVVLYEETQRADLVIAGHTHGGQIRMPVIGPLSHIPTLLGNAYQRGLFTLNEQPFFITSGVGESGTRARLFTPPEIVMMNIRY